MRWLFSCALMCAVLSVCAQQKEASYSNNGFSTNVSKKDLVDKTPALLSATDSLKLKTEDAKAHRLIDSLKQVTAIKSDRIYSEKHWKKYYDSIAKLAPGLPAPGELQPKEINEKELLGALNKKFFAGSDRIESGWKDLPAMPAIKDELSQAEIPVDGLSTRPNFNELTLPATDRLQLPRLSTSVIPSRYLDTVDSIRQINLKTQEAKLNETKISAEQRVASFGKKPSFWDASYLEAVVGFAAGEQKLIQVSPTFGYHFTDYFSLGIGPNLLFKRVEKDLKMTVGLKAFTKIEFLKRQGYVQVEDIMDTYGVSMNDGEDKPFYEQHNIFAGGGWLLSINAPVTLNLSALYCITKHTEVQGPFSPFVFRIGISTVKVKK